jgi:glycosyltransferase involved in cell wall biosynthesis
MGIDETRLICWFLGSFGDTYDLEPVIEAARRLEHRGARSPQFVLSGDGRARERYQRLASGLSNVIFTGWIDADQIASMMQIADVAIAAYKMGAPQGLPNKIFEYMAAGLPILSALDGECKSFLTTSECGLYYEAGNADSFMGALTVLMQDPSLCRRLGDNGRAVFRAQYSSFIVYPKLAAHIERVAASQHYCEISRQREGVESEAYR